ncbi:hypothetical protein GA0070616_3173 [Micromonospora nigra]|uniref:Uncharacterized protein n=1 Tax=Micromonospora nigra TaxID=145857 RepID=A0A1C6S8L9_9ACTN|nr:hypothetical protein [Micromonospora nigra]SCL25775.1 hypothetical protein GA0070616_3173 [Micromonospora nigra]
MTDRDQVERGHRAALLAFLPRARRVEAHSLAQDRAALVALAQMTMQVVIDPARETQTVVQELPPEEVVESAAARLRPLILDEDPTHWGKFFKAVGFFLHAGQVPPSAMEHLKGLKAEWVAIKPRSEVLRGYEVHLSKAGSNESQRVTDNVLGFAWLYGDVVHSDADRLARTRSFGVAERFRAAAPLVAHIMVLTIATLNFARTLYANGWLPVEDEVFETPVVVSDTTFRHEGRIYLGEPHIGDDPVVVPPPGQDLGEGWLPIQQVFGPGSDGAAPGGTAQSETSAPT